MMYAISQNACVSAAKIISRINPVEIVTATNAADEKAKWIGGFSEFVGNPHFTYCSDDLDEARKQFAELASFQDKIRAAIVPENIRDEILKYLIEKRVEEALLALELKFLIIAGGHEAEMTDIVQKMYGFPDSTIVDRAFGMIKDYSVVPPSSEHHLESRFSRSEIRRLESMEFEASSIQYWFENVLTYYGISGWVVDIDKRFTSIDVRDKDSTGGSVVGIPTTRKVNGLKLLELIGHEIESHLRGSENCRALVAELIDSSDSPLIAMIPVLAKSDDELFYEGVAKMSDVSVCGRSSYPLPWSTIAIHQALRGASFADVAQTVYGARLTVGEDPEKAKSSTWQTTYRAMRGAKDLSGKGYAFTKDYIYLAGIEHARQAPEIYRDFASLTVDDIDEIQRAVDLKPSIPNRDAVGWVADQLLA